MANYSSDCFAASSSWNNDWSHLGNGVEQERLRLMLVGVKKVALDLPIDTSFPFIHPEREFMHLAYLVYDVGFQVLIARQRSQWSLLSRYSLSPLLPY